MQHASTIPIIANRRDFLAAAKGSKWIAGSLVLQMHKRAEDHPAPAHARIGYTVSKKVGGAMMRNRAKRRLREASRRIAPNFMQEGYDYVVISRKEASICEFSVLLRDMEFAFSRIHANKRPSY